MNVTSKASPQPDFIRGGGSFSRGGKTYGTPVVVVAAASAGINFMGGGSRGKKHLRHPWTRVISVKLVGILRQRAVLSQRGRAMLPLGPVSFNNTILSSAVFYYWL